MSELVTSALRVPFVSDSPVPVRLLMYSLPSCSCVEMLASGKVDVAVVEVAVKYGASTNEYDDSFPVVVATPETVSEVNPLAAPLVTSHVSEAISILSPPSPRVSVPVVVSVPDMLLAPMVPPDTVIASAT